MHSNLTDAELVLAAQSGDVASLGVLLERHRSDMQAVALAILGYSPEASDAVQDAMLIALRRIGDLRDPSAAGAWLRSIVRNACRMRVRAAKPTIDLEDVSAHWSTQLALPERELEDHALRDWLWSAIEALPEPLRLVLILYHFTGIASYAQIAALCGIPLGTVRSRLHLARRHLATRLQATAEAAHGDAEALTARRARQIADLIAAAERDEFGRTLRAMACPELTLFTQFGRQDAGLDALTFIMHHDYAEGVRQQPKQIVASRRFTIVEARLISPPWDPDHCPPGVVWLITMDGEQIQQVRLFHPEPARESPSVRRSTRR